MKNLALVFVFLLTSSLATIAQAAPSQLTSDACKSLNNRETVICGLLIQEEINANMGSVIEREGLQYLGRQTVMRSDGAYLSLFDRVEAKLGGKIRGAARVQILNSSGRLSIYSLIQQIDRSLTAR